MEWLNGKNKQNDALNKLNVMAHNFSIFKKICAITMAKLRVYTPEGKFIYGCLMPIE